MVAPWKDVKALPTPTQLRVYAFICDLSLRLLDMLMDVIPHLKAAVDRLLAACLAGLPRRTGAEIDNAAELVLLVFRFCVVVRETVDGTGDEYGDNDKVFVHCGRTLYRAFKASMSASAPDFWPFEG